MVVLDSYWDTFSLSSNPCGFGHGYTEEIWDFWKKMKIKEMELVKNIIEDRGSDYDAQFGQKMTKICPKLKRIVQLPLGF